MRKKIFILTVLMAIFCTSQSVYATDMDAIEQEAEEDVKNQVSLTSGTIYEQLHAICPEALLYALYKNDNTLTVDLTDMDTSGGVNTFSHRFMSLSAFILAQCDISTEFKNIDFTYAADGNVISLQISKFENIGDFTSNLWCIADNQLTEWMNTYYDNTYGRHDLQYKLDSETNEIIKKYGGQTQDLDADNCDTLWSESSFQYLKGCRNEEDTLNLKVYGFELSKEGGYAFKQAVLKAQQNFCDIFNYDNSSLSFKNFTITCIEHPSGKEIVSVTFTVDDSYNISGKYSSCADSAFAEGILQ